MANSPETPKNFSQDPFNTKDVTRSPLSGNPSPSQGQVLGNPDDPGSGLGQGELAQSGHDDHNPLDPDLTIAHPQTKRSSPKLSKRWLRWGIGTGVVTLGLLAGGAFWLQHYLDHQLAPQVASTLSQRLKRPVELGRLERYSLSSLRFGPSSLPPTATDPDNASFQALELRFNPWETLRTRNVIVDLTLEQGSAYVEQNPEGAWLDLKLEPQEPGWLTVELHQFRLENSHLTLVPHAGNGAAETSPALSLEGVQGQLTLKQDMTQVDLELQGDLLSQGPGDSFPQTAAGSLGLRVAGAIDGSNLVVKVAPDRLNLEPLWAFVQTQVNGSQNNLPIQITQGSITGNLQADVVAKDLAQVEGYLTLDTLAVQLSGQPQPLSQIQGKLEFQDDRLNFTDVSATWGSLQAQLQGSLTRDRDQWQNSQVNVTLGVAPFNLDQVRDTLGLDTPLPVTGDLTTDITLSGTLQELLVQGLIRTVRQGLDGFKLGGVQAQTRFETRVPVQTLGDRLPLRLEELRVTPQEGGQVAGSGTLFLNVGDLARSSLDLKLSLEALPADTLSQRLGLTVPITLGTIAAQTHITGLITDPQLAIALQALNADYPTLARAQLNRQGWDLEEARISIAGGTLLAQGQQRGDQWTLEVNSQGFRPDRLNLGLPGQVDGQLTLVGPRNQFGLAQIRADGSLTFSEGISVIHDPLLAQVSWDGQDLWVNKATALGFGGQGYLEIQLRENALPQITGLNLEVQLVDYPLEKLPVKLPPPVNLQAEAVNFQGKVTGLPAGPWVQGAVQVQGVTVNSKPFEPELRGALRLNPEGVALRLQSDRDFIETRLDPDFLPRTGKVVWNGGVALVQRQPGDRFDVNLERFPVAALGLELPAPQLGQQPLLGTASGQAQVALDPSFNIAGNLQVTQPALGYLKGQRLTTDFRIADGRVRVQNGVLAVGDSRFTFDGRAIVDTRDPSYELNIAVQDGQTGDVFQVLRWFDIVDVARGLQEPRYSSAADLRLPPVSNPDQPLRLQLHRFSEIKNQVLQVARQRQNQEQLPPLETFQGSFNGEIAVRGTLNSGLESEFNFSGTDWSWGEDYKAQDVVVQGNFKDNRLTFQPAQFRLNDRTEISFQGIIGENPQYGTIKITELPLGLVSRFVDLPVDLEGAVNLDATLAGSIDDPQLLGTLGLADGRLNGSPLRTSDRTSFSFTNDRLTFGTTLFIATGGDQPINIAGEWPNFQSLSLDNVQLAPGQTTITTSEAGAFTPVQRGDAVLGPDIPDGTIVADIQNDGQTLVLSQARLGTPPEPNKPPTPITVTIVPRLRLRLDVADEGIKVLNLFTHDTLNWVGGSGSLRLDVAGTVIEPQANGIITLDGGMVKSSLFPDEPLTDLNGTLEFQNDRLMVNTLTGRFSNGDVSAQGVIALADPQIRLDPNQDSPLAVSFRNLNLTLPGQYIGGAAGDVTILGSILAPRLTGQVQIQNGNVILPDPSTAVTSRRPQGINPDTTPDPESQTLVVGFNPVTFDQLALSLGDNIEIAADPLFNFQATGDLLINGGFENLQPDGTIKLTRGQVNLFTTSFLLARGAANEAVFRPSTGLDPNLNVEMVASVTEVSNRTLTAGPLSSNSEVNDATNPTSGFGELQTVRIRANVEGPASEILQNLRLSSRPARTPSELYALMGGGFVNTLGQGGNSTLALANLAGSALINNLQNALNGVLSGPVDLRLFPVVVESQNRRDRAEQGNDVIRDSGADTLALGAEVGVNLTNSVSFSMLRLLTIDLPTRLNLNYQFSDNWQMRATTDLQDENRFVVEYEARF